MINIGNIVTKQANLKANKLAVYDQPNDKRVSFSELNNMVNKIANTLLELGVCKGDRVSILSQNCVEYFALFFACAKTGAILQTLNWRLADQEISKIVSNGDPKVFIYQGQFSETVEHLKSTENNVAHWLGYGPESDNLLYTIIEPASTKEPKPDWTVGGEDPLLFFILVAQQATLKVRFIRISLPISEC